MADTPKVLALKLDYPQKENDSANKVLLNGLIELISLLDNPSPTTESLIRADKFAQSCLDSPDLDTLPSYPEFKNFPVASLISSIKALRNEKKDINASHRFLAFVLSVYTKNADYTPSQVISRDLIQLAKDLYADSPTDEHITVFYLMSCVCYIREPSTKTQPQVDMASTILTSYTDLYFSYADLSKNNLSLVLSAMSEFVTNLAQLFADNGAFDFIPFLLPILQDNAKHPSVCLAALMLLKNSFMFNPDIKHDPNFLSLPNTCCTILELHPRDVDITRELFVMLTNFMSDQKEVIPQLADASHPLLAYCITALEDATCPIRIQFNVCPFIALIVFSLETEQTTNITRLLLKCIARTRDEKTQLPDAIFAATSGITFSYPIGRLSKDPVSDTSTLPPILSCSEFQDLLGVTMSHTHVFPILIQSLKTLDDVMQRNRGMSYTTELLRGLRNAFKFFHRTGDKEAISFILRLIYGINKEDRQQAQALVDSEIEGVVTECLSEEPDINMIMMFITILNGLIGCYHQLFKDVRKMSDPAFHNTLITLLFRPTPPTSKESLHEVVGFCFMNLTCDKTASISMYEHGVIPKMLEFISTPEHYTGSSVRAALHAMANIGIHSAKAKEYMFENGMHIMLVDLIRGVSTDPEPDWPLYCACVRGIQILASGDVAKQTILKTDLVSAVLHCLKRNPSMVEVIWRSFTFMASLSYVALPDREQFFTKQFFELISMNMKKMKHGKIFGYGCFFFLSMSEHDLGVRYTGDLKLDESIFEAINKPSLVAEMDDLKRWCFDCLDKFVCHVIPRPKTLTPSADVLPNNIDNFLIHRHYGVTRHCCSNCDAEAPRSEVVMRPDAVVLEQYQLLVNNGWYRRGGSKMFRFNSQHRRVCFDWETRVRVREFKIESSKTFKRVLKKVPNNVVIETVPARLTQEGVDLYNNYHRDKHDKPPKTPEAYAEHAVHTPLKLESRGDINYGTFHQEYRLNGKLIAIGIIDVILNGVVSVYFFYDMSKEVSKMSLGVFSSLKEIEYVQSLNKKNPDIQYYYLQGWNGPNHKLAYKANYKPIEFCSPCLSPYWTEDIEIPYIQTGFLQPLPEVRFPLALTSVASSCPDLSSDTENGYRSVDIDRAYLSEVHQITVKGKNVRVFLNGEVMRCEELLSKYKVYSETKQYIYESLEELALALGHPLCHKLIVIFKFSEQIPDT